MHMYVCMYLTVWMVCIYTATCVLLQYITVLSYLQEEQRKKEHEERLDRATRSVSEEVEVCLLQWRGRGL